MLIVVVAAVVYMNIEKPETTPTEDEQAAALEDATTGGGASVLGGVYGLSGVDWVFAQTKEGDGMNPPRVSARIQPLGVTRPDGRKIEVATWRLGEYDGSCASITKPADEKGEALGYAQCWWAGGGKQFRAVRDGNILRVDVRDVDEMEEAPATFKQLVVIDLAAIVK